MGVFSFFSSAPQPPPSLLKSIPQSLPNLPNIPLQLPKNFPESKLQLFAIAGAATLGTVALATALSGPSGTARPKAIPSPKDTVLPELSDEAVKDLPYPPFALPGSRDVDSPYGNIQVYEWGPEDGDRVLLIHGISTPSVALARLAHKLVQKGCRVMLFDLFGRGYSCAPDPSVYRYDSALYTNQIFLCLQSSPIPWRSFHVIGYSLGGAIAADFTSYFPALVSGLVLIAPGGLIRPQHIGWGSKFLYSPNGYLPEWMVESFAGRRLWTGPESARTIEPEPEVEISDTSSLISAVTDDGGKIGHKNLLKGIPNSTAGNVVDWQIQNHRGFVKAFISSIRYAPIHSQHERWQQIGKNIDNGIGRMKNKQVYVILGENDPIIIADEISADVKEALGEHNVRIEVLKDTGHEIPIERPSEITRLVREMFRGTTAATASSSSKREREHKGKKSSSSRSKHT
ncbi:Alpha/Beta hydrolase protein [Dendryphion nanum]|uniref:Alpha/Beta hydrolase protein n=1 Tax=Dendryphion nanum TaxID=256645 RepID=A0A9P9DXV5_9PLEO|nr:Alpha/Beta hydrolase protein [Dendryphion nanum]